MRPTNTTNMAGLNASTDQTGSVINSAQTIAVSVQALVTGTSTGTLNLQVSNDLAPAVDSYGVPTPIHWTSIANVSISGAGVYLIPFTNCCYNYIRTQFTHSNGASGTITVNVNETGV